MKKSNIVLKGTVENILGMSDVFNHLGYNYFVKGTTLKARLIDLQSKGLVKTSILFNLLDHEHDLSINSYWISNKEDIDGDLVTFNIDDIKQGFEALELLKSHRSKPKLVIKLKI